MYLVHPDGGTHMFAHRCSSRKELKSIYRENIWPYIERICKYTKVKGRTPIEKVLVLPGITKKDPYPRCHFRSIKKINGTHGYHIYFHQLLSGLLGGKIPGGCVNHINGKPGDYRLKNLEWTTYTGNAKGIKIPRLDYDVMYDSLLKNEYI